MCCRSCSKQSDKHNQIRASECSKSPEYEPSEALGTDTDILRAFTVSEQPSSFTFSAHLHLCALCFSVRVLNAPLTFLRLQSMDEGKHRGESRIMVHGRVQRTCGRRMVHLSLYIYQCILDFGGVQVQHLLVLCRLF